MIKDKESGIAFALFMLVLFAVVATIVVVVVFGPMFNSFNGVVNTWVETGQVSSQTVAAVKWNEMAANMVAIITLIGMFVFAVVRAIYRKKMPGEDF